MNTPRFVSPILDGFMTGEAISDHNAVRCYPAMKEDADDKFIVKTITVPSSKTQLDALLLTGAYSSEEEALSYFHEMAKGVCEEVDLLTRLSALEGFVPYLNHQIEPTEDGSGYEVFLISEYKRSLSRQFTKEPLTQLGAINLGLDLCAALTVCRRAGYIYVDLKPNNVFVTGDKEYKIGDLGFVRLDGLRYASLPDKYRSDYTAPEVSDAFAPLNDTLDIYALGLILYQAYNNGALPDFENTPEGTPFQPPQYADYEIAEIILKACAPKPEDRWASPIQMGQAIVSYMQRNGANDTPIIPVINTEETVEDAQTPSDDQIDTDISEQSEAADTDGVPEENITEDVPAAESDLTAESQNAYENLSFLDDISEDDIPEDISYEEISEDVSQILAQADDLATLEVPEPVVAPEAIDVPVPEPIDLSEEVDAETETDDITQEQDADSVADADVDTDNADTNEQSDPAAEAPPKKKKHWVRNSILVVLILALLGAGVWFVRNYYLLSIDEILLEGSEDGLTVWVTSDINDSLLTVVCSDSHGNQLSAPVVDGKAVFSDLVPDTAYNVKVLVSGFHKLTGDSSSAYSTPVQTNIVQFNAVTGAEEGSVILGFTVDGPDSQNWSITYSAPGETEQTVSFPGHMYTLTGLTVGKEYTFSLHPEDNLYITGTDEILHTTSKLLYPQNLYVVSCVDGKLTASWEAPEDATVGSWTVRCFNETDYNETQLTEGTVVTFENLNDADAFTVEVIAEGMSVGSRTQVPKNATTIYDMTIEPVNGASLKLDWKCDKTIPEDGWVIKYSIDGAESYAPVYCSENSAVIYPLVPGADYVITIQKANGEIVLGTPYHYASDKAKEFTCDYDGYTITAQDMTFQMCKRPEYSNWNRYYLDDSDYTTTFSSGEEAAFVVKLGKGYGDSYDTMHILYVIRDASGALISTAVDAEEWSDIWSYYYGELDIPSMPERSGDYKMEIYFNGALAGTQEFTIA